MNIGEKINQLRKEKGMTQKELASELNVTDKAISRWESGQGNPDLELIPKIASIFNVTTDFLLKDDEIVAKEEVEKIEEIIEKQDINISNNIKEQEERDLIIAKAKRNKSIFGNCIGALLVLAIFFLILLIIFSVRAHGSYDEEVYWNESRSALFLVSFVIPFFILSLCGLIPLITLYHKYSKRLKEYSEE